MSEERVGFWGGGRWADLPSIRKRPLAPSFPPMTSVIAFSSNCTVTSIGTMMPSLMCSLIISPNWLPFLSCSALSRSPADKCVKP